MPGWTLDLIVCYPFVQAVHAELKPGNKRSKHLYATHNGPSVGTLGVHIEISALKYRDYWK